MNKTDTKNHLTSSNCHLEYNEPYLQILGETGLLPSILYPANGSSEMLE